MPSGPAAKGPRLWLEPARVRPDGSLAEARWCIRDDGRYKRRLEFGAAERGGAEAALAGYIAEKHQIAPGELEPGQRLTSDVLNLYLEEVVPGHARPAESASRIGRLVKWWGQPAFAMRDMHERNGKSRRMTGHLTDIDATTCRSYVAHVGAERSGAMDLSILRAAMNHAVKEGKLTRVMAVSLPEEAPARERWLTRPEAASALWMAWRARRDRNGVSKAPDGWGTRKHIARFILASLYTGTRKETVLLAAFERIPGYGFIDLEAGLWYRKPFGKRATKKRQTPVRIPDRLLSHMRRWRAAGQTFLIEYNGKPVDRIDKAFRGLMVDCELPGEKVTPHTLKHTAITWALQSGMQPWDAAGFFGITLETLDRVYGHHSPAHLRTAADIMTRAGKSSSAAQPRTALSRSTA